MVRHVLTVDVEEWFHATALEPVLGHRPRSRWPSRVADTTHRLLDMFGEAGARATFFVLGSIAEEHPDLVRRMAQEGHEVGTHGYDHTVLPKLSPEQFRKELERAVDACQSVTGRKLLGHRAPSYSLTESTEWALDTLIETGITYDSSMRRGPEAMSAPYWISRPSGARIREFPMAYVRVGRRTIPVAAGGYFRLYPYAMTRRLLRRYDRRGIPANVCVHPWELDVDHPRPAGMSALTHFRHYVNLHTVEPKVRKLLRDFRFGTMADALGLA